MFFGLIIVLIGVIFLLQNLGVITGDAWNYIWPAIIILIGLSMLFRPWRSKFFCQCGHKGKGGERKEEGTTESTEDN